MPKSLVQTRIVVGAVLAITGALTATLVELAAAVPVPTVTGPLPATALGDPGHDYPFYAAAVDLKARGFVEEEFFIEGTANRYATPPQATATVASGGHPYKTRLLVRRPASGSRFNGTVIVEWNNVTASRDLDIDWFQTHDHLMRSGYAWVGVSAQRVGVEALKVWSAKRYGALDVTHGGTIANDDLSYDIFAQAGQAVRTPGKIRIMGDLKVARVFATGHSQSAGRLGTYVNSVHPLAKVFDAVILHGGGSRVRPDLDIPVWKLLAETDVQNQAANRQPDTGKFRTWEVAGNSHVDLQFTTYSRKLATRDGSPSAPPSASARAGAGRSARAGAGRGGQNGAATGARGAQPAATPAGASASQGGLGSTTASQGGCDRPPYSHIPFHYVFNAALDHLVRWVKDGTPPPQAPPIDVTTVGPPAVMARDAAGNALGGIRLSQHAVPTAVNTGVNSGPGFCRLYGSFEPFDGPTLAKLYPTHDSYVRKVKEVTEKNLKAGYILKIDAEATIEEAEQSAVGR